MTVSYTFVAMLVSFTNQSGMKKNLFCFLLMSSILLLITTAVHAQKKKATGKWDLRAASGQPYNAASQARPSGVIIVCDPDSITLTRQSQVDSFPKMFPFCTVFRKLTIDGEGASPAITNLDSLKSLTEVIQDLTIKNTSVTTLSPFINLTAIGGGLWINNNSELLETGITTLTRAGLVIIYGNSKLANIDGLTTNFTENGMGTLILDNTLLTDLTGLEGIHTIPNMYVSGNPNLESLHGLHNLVQADYGISIYGNGQLNDLTALSQIQQISDGTLEIAWLQSLDNLQGLQNIQLLGGGLWVTGNDNLTSLGDLNPNLEIQNNNDDLVRIEYNYQLSLCSFSPLCNYLNNDGGAIIHDNGSGCSSRQEILDNCGICNTVTLKTWTGSIDTDWDNPGNWSPAAVPNACDSVYIPSDADYFPTLNQNVFIQALTMDPYSELDLNYYGININGNVSLEDCYLYQGTFFNVLGANEIYMSYAEINADNINLTGIKGSMYLDDNYFYGNVKISDATSRSDEINLNGNYIDGNLTVTLTANENYPATNISDYQNDEVTGNVQLNVYSAVDFFVGNNSSLVVNGSLVVNSEYPYSPLLGGITFGSNSSADVHVTQLGSAPLSIERLHTDKFGGGNIILDQDVHITGETKFGAGIIRSAPDKLLIFESSGFISQTSSASHVWGPIKKIGSNQFLFPVGDSIYSGAIQISDRQQGTDAFTARFYRRNPISDGYDTSLHAASIKAVAGDQYWTLEGTSGAPAGRSAAFPSVFVTLNWDSTKNAPLRTISDLKVARWNGTQWVDEGASLVSGTSREAFVTSAGSIDTFGVFTLSYFPVRVPIITIGNVDSLPCRSAALQIPFTLDTLAQPGNRFSAYLSDQNGSFANQRLIGFLDTQTGGNISTFIPSNVLPGSGYRIRIVGTRPFDTSTNTVPVRIITNPQQNFTITGASQACIGAGSVKYYASQKEEGVTYTWTLNNGGTLTASGDTATVTWTSAATYQLRLQTSNTCGNGPQATLNVSVSQPAPNAAPIVNNIGRWLYASAPAASQYSLGYRWYKNGVQISGATSSSYYAGDAGNYSAHYYNLCGNGPLSNAINFTSTSIPQNITFAAISDKTYGNAPFSLGATSSSGLQVQYTIVSGSGNISGDLFTITGTGTIIIRALQPGDNQYDTASPVTRTFIVNKAAQTITFNPISNQLFSSAPLPLNATASSGSQVNYNVTAGNGSIYSGNQFYQNGLGNVTIQATQAGNANYLPANAVSQTFCVFVADLTSIAGPQYACPSQAATYSINKVNGLIYTWRLSNGTAFSSNADTVAINWSTPGIYTIIVSAQGPCGGPTSNDSLTVNVVNPVTPAAVSNMLPADGAKGQELPLTLSWLPGANSLTYDLYIWDSAATQPAKPFASNLTAVSYIIPQNAIPYNQSYKWKVVAKNACLQTPGPVQHFRLIPLPDLIVSNVQAPAAANSGQTISIDWTVTNIGPGNTTTSQRWTDAVFLSFDSLPAFNISPAVNPPAWSALSFPVRPLLVGTRSNVTALDSGQSYTNSISFTLPRNYNQPLFVHVVANYPNSAAAPVQMDYKNDTAHLPQQIAVTLSPAPDLRVDTVFTPASTFSGNAINVTYKVHNYGVLTPAGSVWTDKFYISQSPFFDPDNAVQLKFPKPNGSYYPNAANADYINNVQLENDETYTRSVQLVVPNFIFGSYFIYVVTNSNGGLYEGPAASNNTGRAALQVFLTPTPQLTITNLSVPLTTASVTQPIGINWSILNQGFTDNIEKNKGHYFVPLGQCFIPVPPCGKPNCVSLPIPGTLYLDSLDLGSSYWIDRIYLSTNASAFDASQSLLVGTINHGIQNSGLNVIDNPKQPTCGSLLQPGSNSGLNISNVILPKSTFPASLNFKVPNNLPENNYYIYIVTNPTKTVFEYPGTLQVKRSDAPVAIRRPDLAVTALNVPATAAGGQAVNVEYKIDNNGAGSVFSALRHDRVYISSSSVFDGSATLIGDLSFTEDLASGANVTHNFTYTLPQNTLGMRYIFVQVNFDSTFRETSYSNNSSSAGMNVSAAAPNDLIVSAFPLADTVYTVYNTYFKYTVSNIGTGITSGNWVDSIFIGCNGTFDRSTTAFITKRSQNRLVLGGESYTDSFYLSLPVMYEHLNCLPAALYGNAYFFIKTNADDVVYEGANTGNNLTGSGIRVLVNPLVDHIVPVVSAADTALVGRPYTVNYTVQNIGLDPGTGLYSRWYDGVFFSPDSVYNNKATLANSFLETERLAPGKQFSRSRTVTPPKLPTGDYYLMATTNLYNYIRNEINTNNNFKVVRDAGGKPKKIHLDQPPLPDMVDSITFVDANLPVGQPFTVIHQVKNIGQGPIFPNFWSSRFWLSTDLVPGNTGDLSLAVKNYSNILQPGETLTDTISGIIPLNTTPGNYVLIMHVDAGNNVIENSDTNNTSHRFITIYRPQPSDLTVQQVSIPDTVLLGYTIDTLKWTVANISSNLASGVSSDGIYLSKKTILDTSAVLLGVVNKDLYVPPLGSSQEKAVPLVSNLTEGSYNVLVRTDVLNNIVESDKNNNVGLAPGSIYVKVKELVLNVMEQNTMKDISRHYKLIIPDSLEGSTIRILLKTNDSLLVRNEMFVGKGYVPGPAQSDFQYEIPDYGNQQIIMSSVTSGVYYITIRTVTPNPPTQNITLLAERLPFAVLMVQSSSGGNIGNVTVKINGSLFVPNMQATLTRSGTTITASAVYFTNSTQVYATFNLQGRPLGMYDVTLTKPEC